MLVYLLDWATSTEQLSLSFIRCFLAFITSLAISVLFGSKLINILRRHQKKGQPIREDGPQSHLLNKKGTPTMGGFLILGSSVISTFLFCNLTNLFVWAGIGVLIIYGLVGFADDYVKVTKQTANAMTAKMKLLLQFSTAFAAIILISSQTPEAYRFVVQFPYFSSLNFNLGWIYILFAMFVIAGASNGVNLSDGLDGLASGLLTIAFTVFMIAALISGGAIALSSETLRITGTTEIAVMCASVIGGCSGFLWFNSKPAEVFMGDTGSLALGAFLGLVAVIIKQELLLVISGGIFVLESISVIIQVSWFKYTHGKRFFRMAPIHHHFEQLGWPETKVVARFWICGIILAAIALMSFVL